MSFEPGLEPITNVSGNIDGAKVLNWTLVVFMSL